MALYHKYRPNSLQMLLGNEELIDSLESVLSRETPPQAFLFTGPTGCGKTTLGRITANMLGCVGDDYVELDSAQFTGVDTIREIRQQSHLQPYEGDCRVWLLDEMHQLSTPAQNALLKALEDTPKHVHYILCTTDPQKVLDTIKGRCSQFKVEPLNENDMGKLLKRVCKKEGVQIEQDVLDQITEDSLGYPRNALQVLDKVIGLPAKKRLAAAKKAGEAQSQSIELCRALLNGVGWAKVAGLLTAMQGQKPEDIRSHIRHYCNSVLLKKKNDIAFGILQEFEEPRYGVDWPSITACCYTIINSK